MKHLKFNILIMMFVFIAFLLQAQQSEFQGIWIGEDFRSNDRLEITGNSWSHFYNNTIQGAGTARFSTGRAELLIANGNIYFDLTLLAPGLIFQPITMWDGLYRFRRVPNAEELIKQADDNIKNWFDTDWGNRNSRFSTEAIWLYTEAIRFFPTNATAYNNRGLAIWLQSMVNKNNQDRAIADFTKAIQLNPNYAEAYFNRGNAYRYWRGDDDKSKAIADYTEAIRLNSNYVEAYCERAVLFHIDKDFDKAISDYESALRLGIDFITSYRPGLGIDYTLNAYKQLLEIARQKENFDSSILWPGL